jgi:hypothetical protein
MLPKSFKKTDNSNRDHHKHVTLYIILGNRKRGKYQPLPLQKTINLPTLLCATVLTFFMFIDAHGLKIRGGGGGGPEIIAMGEQSVLDKNRKGLPIFVFIGIF